MEEINIEQITEEVNNLTFPAAEDGNTLLYKNFWFIRIDGQWALDESKE